MPNSNRERVDQSSSSGPALGLSVIGSLLLGALIVVFLIVLAVNRPSFDFGGFNNDDGGLPVGTAAPEVAGEDIDGVPFRLSDYRGKVVMISFWGDW